MRLTLNGEPREVDAANVTELIRDLGLEGRAVAVEINQNLVPKANHPATELREGDALEVVTLVGGG